MFIIYLEKLDDILKQFVKINGYEDYFINNEGVIINTKRIVPRVMQPKKTTSGQGYYSVGLRDSDGKRSFKLVHRLVALHFLKTPTNWSNMMVNHMDGNTLNNNVNNLEWVTPKENSKHALNCDNCKQNSNRCILMFEHVQIGQYESKKDAIEYVVKEAGYSFDSIRKHFSGQRMIMDFPYYIIRNDISTVHGVKSKGNYWEATLTKNKTRYSKSSKSFDDGVKNRMMFESIHLGINSHKYKKDTETLCLKYMSVDDDKQTFIECNLSGEIINFKKLN